MLNKMLACHTLSQDEFKTKWEGVSKSLTKENFTVAFKRCKKVVCIDNGYTDKK
jgi:hypothetical protein